MTSNNDKCPKGLDVVNKKPFSSSSDNSPINNKECATGLDPNQKPTFDRINDDANKEKCYLSRESERSASKKPFDELLNGTSKECPRAMDSDKKSFNINSRNMMPTDLETSGGDGNSELSNERISSSIPKSDTETTWLYPSPSMFYAAMKRKGNDNLVARAEDMGVIITIHNMVNEQTWQSILRWEKYYHPNSQPKLKRFLGRPENVSPKAWVKTWLFGYKKPFDRHDWYVERRTITTNSVNADEKNEIVEEVRYVIDFYSGQAPKSAGASVANLPSFHIDARPAIDDFQSTYERLHCVTKKFINSFKKLVIGQVGGES